LASASLVHKAQMNRQPLQNQSQLLQALRQKSMQLLLQ
jgi:hypothetical protein